MTRNHNTPKGVNASGLPLESLPLFRWAMLCPPEHFPDISRPARVIARRFGLAPLRARLIAELAGFNVEHNQHG